MGFFGGIPTSDWHMVSDRTSHEIMTPLTPVALNLSKPAKRRPLNCLSLNMPLPLPGMYCFFCFCSGPYDKVGQRMPAMDANCLPQFQQIHACCPTKTITCVGRGQMCALTLSAPPPCCLLGLRCKNDS